MAVQGIGNRITRLPVGTLAFLLAALAAACLSLAAALVGFTHEGGGSAPLPSAADELRARNDRIAFFETRAAADPIDYISRNTLAREYLQRARETGDAGDYERADLAVTQSLAILPGDNFGGHVLSASVKLVKHEYASALEAADRAVPLKPQDAAGYAVRGDAAIGLGRYDDASKAYQQMVLIEPGLPALSRLADLAWWQGDVANAEDFWKQALRTRDGLPVENLLWARVQLGQLYFSQGDLKRASSQYEEALKASPDYVHALAGLAAVRAAQERWDESIDLYRRAEDRLPQTLYVSALGDVYTRTGQTAEAQTQYELVGVIDQLFRARGINTDLALAIFFADHDRDLARALVLAQNAYDAGPNVAAADALSWALLKNGRVEDAARMSDKALSQGTVDASFHYHAALIQRALGNRDAAISHLERALAINPHFSILHATEAKALLAELKQERGR